MTSDLDMHDLAQQIACLEERMETKQAEYRTDIARLAETMAHWKTDMAQRETRMLLAMAGMIGLAVTILGILITLPA